MTCKGRIKNGVVVLEAPSALPEGTEVRVEPVEPPDTFNGLREGLMKFAGTMEGMPDDMAENHDHYLHGAPKK